MVDCGHVNDAFATKAEPPRAWLVVASCIPENESNQIIDIGLEERKKPNLDNERLDIETISRVAARVDDLAYIPMTDNVSCLMFNQPS